MTMLLTYRRYHRLAARPGPSRSGAGAHHHQVPHRPVALPGDRRNAPPAGAKQKIAFSTSSFVTVTLADSAGGKVMRVVVDSLRGDSATPIPAAVLDSARGAEFHGFVEKSGKPTGLEPVTAAPAVRQIQGLLSDFFPWTRAGLKVGDSWTDTTAKTNGVGTDSVTVRRVSAYKAAANETGAARKAYGSPRTLPPPSRAPSRLRTARPGSRAAGPAKAPTT